MRNVLMLRALWTVAFVLAAPLQATAKPPLDPDWTENGIASWYGPGFAGNPTASGEIYDPNHLTAAHKTLPLGTLVRVYNVDNDREMIVRINDRGPFIDGRVIDLSRAAAEVLGFHEDGLAQVELTVVQAPRTRTAGKALMEAVERAASAGLHAIVPADSRADAEPHVAEATQDAPTRPSFSETHAAPDTRNSSEDWNTRYDEDGFYIQVGAFRDSFNAEDLIRRVEGLGMSPRLRETGNIVRVLVGPFAARTDAVRAQGDLERAGITSFVRTSQR